MEDFVRVVQPFGQADLYAAVFDGHGGTAVSDRAADRLHGILASELERQSTGDALKSAFAKFESEVARERAGAVAVVCVLEGPTLTIANVGDCHALVVSEGRQEILTVDHRVDNQEELRRVVAAGATIRGPYLCLPEGAGVMNARAFGDSSFKRIGVIAEPAVTSRDLRPEDDWLVLGSDGLWDPLTVEHIAAIVRSEATAATAADRLIKVALSAGDDNVSAVVVRLNDASDLDKPLSEPF